MRLLSTLLIATAGTVICCAVSHPNPVKSTAQTASPASSGGTSNSTSRVTSQPLPPATTDGAVLAPPPTNSARPAKAVVLQNTQLKRSQDCSEDPTIDLARGRKLASTGRWQEALVAYDRAVRKLPGDPTLRAERGLALYRLGAIDLAEADWLLGTGLTEQPSLLSALHFNLGMLYDDKQLAEPSRLHLAFAESLGNKAAGRRLGDKSRCRATWTLAPKVSPAPLAASLKELLQQRRFSGCPELPAVSMEQQAAGWLCRSCLHGEFGSDVACSLKFPVDVTDGSLSFAIFNFFAETLPVTPPQYLYFYTTAEQVPKWKVTDGMLAIDGVEVRYDDLSDGLGNTLYATPEQAYTEGNSTDLDATHQSCMPEYGGESRGPDGMAGPSPLSGSWTYPVAAKVVKTTTVYSITTRAPLLLIESFGGKVDHKIEGKRVTLSGIGCKEVVSLPEEPRVGSKN